MTNRAAAGRYARALLEVSQKDGDPARVERELTGFVELSEAHPTLRDALGNPAVPPAKKEALVGALLSRLSDLSGVTRRLLTLLAARDRLVLLPEILAMFRQHLLDLQGVIQARITTASPLEPTRVDAIAASLRQSTGREVRITADVDASIIGGLVTEIGSTVFDGSVAHHLKRLRRRFLAEA